MKNLAIILSIIILMIACKKEEQIIDPRDKFVGTYYGKKRTAVHYEEYEPGNGMVSKTRADSAYYSFVVTVDGNNLVFKEYDANNVYIHKWDKLEVNNVGQLAFLKTDTTGFGNITSDTLIFKVSHDTPYPPDNITSVDTLFYTYYYTLSK